LGKIASASDQDRCGGEVAKDLGDQQDFLNPALGGGTKEKIRDAMSSVFNHAIRWEFTDRNPITGPIKGSGVRVSAKRERTPDVLEVEEMRLLLGALGVRERAMVFLDMALGLRRGESAGLKWEYVHFEKLYLNVTRSVVDQQIGNTKAEVSRKPVPIDDYLAKDLLAWREQTQLPESVRLGVCH
jgi:integrase